MTDKTDLGDRMKIYEQAEAGRRLMPMLPILCRIDGKSFSKYTKGFERPFDAALHEAMVRTTEDLVDETGALAGYTQSDEITLLWFSDSLKSQVFFDGKTQKMVSVTAAIATARFAQHIGPPRGPRWPVFDSRVWQVPTKQEAANCFLWRERDATKNSVQMLARHHFSHKQCHLQSTTDLITKLECEKGMRWDEWPACFKRGTFVVRRRKSVAFSADEIGRLPAKHEARTNPNLVVERSVIERVDMPPFGRVIDRVGVLFDGAEPVAIGGERVAA